MIAAAVFLEKPMGIDSASCDTVFHLAKCEGKRWQDYVDGDIAPTKVLGHAALDAGVRRFIYTGTIDSYASADPDAVIDCDTPVDPRIETRNHYARSKAACKSHRSRYDSTEAYAALVWRPVSDRQQMIDTVIAPTVQSYLA